MFSFKEREPWQKWVEHHERRFQDMRLLLGGRMIEVWPDQIVDNPESFRPVADHCELPFDLNAVVKAIDKDKWHQAA